MGMCKNLGMGAPIYGFVRAGRRALILRMTPSVVAAIVPPWDCRATQAAWGTRVWYRTQGGSNGSEGRGDA